MSASGHGLFQISGDRWCSKSLTDTTNVCQIACDKLEDSYIADDIACARKIHALQGFEAWKSFERNCQYHTTTYTKDCFLTVTGVTDPPEATTMRPMQEVGKVYGLCEFARALRYIHNFPADQINSWTCIVEYESSFNTSAIGKLNKDYSTDYGEFLLTSLYVHGIQ